MKDSDLTWLVIMLLVICDLQAVSVLSGMSGEPGVVEYLFGSAFSAMFVIGLTHLVSKENN